MYDKLIKEVFGNDDIIITRYLDYLGEKEGYNINNKFDNSLKNRIYSRNVDNDFLLFKFMRHRG